jgi:hypothetical protein
MSGPPRTTRHRRHLSQEERIEIADLRHAGVAARYERASLIVTSNKPFGGLYCPRAHHIGG